MSEREINEEYSKVDRQLRELTLLALLGLSWGEYAKRFGAICRDWRKALPSYIDWWALYQGLWHSYRKYFVAFKNSVDESGKLSKNARNLLKSFGKCEPFAKKESKIDLRSELSSEIRHHEQYETLRKELGIDGKGMKELFGKWADFPDKGGLEPYEEETYEDQGDLFVISTHKGCSNRCLPDQGKLVSKSMEAVSGLWTGKTVDGRNVYSLKAMFARRDRYGYPNFILTGFNCRHHLYKYNGEMPHRYRFAEAREAYKEEQKARTIERACRKLNNLAIAHAKIDVEATNVYRKKWDRERKIYLAYCKKADLEPKEWLLK